MPKELTIHSLRHTHITHMVLAGVPLIEVSRRVGHAKPDITMAKYSHLVPGYVGSATAAVEAVLYRQATDNPLRLRRRKHGRVSGSP